VNARLRAIQRRRAALLTLADAQRDYVVVQAREWARPLAFLDAGLAVVRAVSTGPVLVMFGAALLTSFRWPRLGIWLERASIAWQVYHTVRQAWPARHPAAPKPETAGNSAPRSGESPG
jgi:hypothetical protein